MKTAIILLIAIVILGGFLFWVGWQDFKQQATASSSNINYHLQEAKKSFLDLKIKDTGEYFLKIKNEIDKLNRQLPSFSRFIPILKNLPQTFEGANQLSEKANEVTQKIAILQKDGLGWIINRQGNKLVDLLKDLRLDIKVLKNQADDLREQTQKLNLSVNGNENIKLLTNELYATDILLNTLINWLDDEKAKHLIIIFQNSSEIRPSGGFFGSLAQTTLIKGGLVNIEIEDIYDIDGQLTAKIKPPLPLQSITADWQTRDAGWFFDFPTSAKKILSLLELSKIYQEQQLKFDGLIAIDVKLIEEILKITGPIEIKEERLMVASNNFMNLVQYEVEKKQNKDILKKLTPLLFEKIGGLATNEKIKLIEIIRDQALNKNIQIYSKELIFETFIKNLGVAGEISDLKKDFQGDYLAIVNANVAGGKTDGFIDQSIKLNGFIDGDGIINNKLTIRRFYNNHNLKDAWYNKDNQNYLQILTPYNSQLINFNGGINKKISPVVNYEKQNYKIDQDLEAIGAYKSISQKGEVYNQFNKTTFAAWLKTKQGATDTITANYKLNKNIELIEFKSPQKYTFIFDKQAGVKTSFEWQITSPPGFIWQETKNKIFTYKSETAPARIILKLNLIRD